MKSSEPSLNYPRPNPIPAEVFTQSTFEAVHGNLMSWRQGPGTFGGLHLHACWSIATVLTDRYQGPTTAPAYWQTKGFMALYDRTGDPRFQTLADECISHLLFLQTAEGGFRHANYQMEPAYDCEQSCPIHQGLPLLALMAYAEWKSADPRRVAHIRPAIDRHWAWFERRWWRYGNDLEKPLPHAGFCGVTNQDLVIVAALARYAAVFGERSRYDRFGRPTLDAFLTPRYYHEACGVFERGDEANFVERTTYNEIIIPMLELVHASMPDPRLPAVIDNVTAHLFDAIHTGEDGCAHFAWGPTMDATDKSAVTGWIQRPHGVSVYPQLLQILRRHLTRHPSPALQAKYDAVEKTLAAYVFADGSVPFAVGTKDPIFAVIGRVESLWYYLIQRLGDRLRSPQDAPPPISHRTCGSVTWRADARHWTISRDGHRQFAGLKAESRGIVHGPRETLPGAAFEQMDEARCSERIQPFP